MLTLAPRPVTSLLLWVAASLVSPGSSLEPDFSYHIANVSVPVGRDAVLSCSVHHLEGYKVGWVKADTKAIQAIETTIVTHDSRVSVEFSPSPTANETKEWKLVIKNVRKEDAGAYMCQINTDPMKSQVGYLDVTEPPNIDDDATPSEQRLRELSPMRLSCTATGRPLPKIIWRREDMKDLKNDSCRDPGKSSHSLGRNRHRSSANVPVVESHLCSNKVTRYHMGSYLCIATNGVLPSVSKRINLVVLFAPTVRADNQMIGAPTGIAVHLECVVEASPMGIHLWYKEDMILSGDRYSASVTKLTGYTFKMTLTIESFRSNDTGRYVCRARNSFGEADGNILLYEMPQWTRETTWSTSTPTSVSLPTSDASLVSDNFIRDVVTLAPSDPFSSRPFRRQPGRQSTTASINSLLLANDPQEPTPPVPRIEGRAASSSAAIFRPAGFNLPVSFPILLLLFVTCSTND